MSTSVFDWALLDTIAFTRRLQSLFTTNLPREEMTSPKKIEVDS
jgi:hypothetical protein